MEYAVVVTVDIDAARTDEAEKLLNEQVIPMTRDTPGLVSACWLRAEDKASGVAVLVFETKQAAEDALRANPPDAQPPDGPVKLTGARIDEVVGKL